MGEPEIFWRRCGDLNPSAGRTDLPDFESGPFSRLGTSPNIELFAVKNFRGATWQDIKKQ